MASSSNPTVEQAAAIPFRRRKDIWEFCLITSIRRGKWGFPKGMIDPGETFVETALKEAYEEAGLHGEIVGEPLGNYEYGKWGLWLNVTVVLMDVTRTDDEWDEQHMRRRRWVNEDKARKLLEKPELHDLLDVATERIFALSDSRNAS